MSLGNKELLTIKLTRIIYATQEENTKEAGKKNTEHIVKNTQICPDDPNQESGYFYADCTEEHRRTDCRRNRFTILQQKFRNFKIRVRKRKSKIIRILASVFLRQ